MGGGKNAANVGVLVPSMQIKHWLKACAQLLTGAQPGAAACQGLATSTSLCLLALQARQRSTAYFDVTPRVTAAVAPCVQWSWSQRPPCPSPSQKRNE
jgi:hypothetical protein